MPLSTIPQIQDFGNILEVIWNVFQMILDMISSVSNAMITFYNMLVEFNNTVLTMASDASAGRVGGLPVNQSISTFRYLVGDVAFYILYIIILFGCLMTVLKIIYLILDAWNSMHGESTGLTSFKTGLASILGKFLK